MSIHTNQYEFIYSPSYWLAPLSYYACLLLIDKPIFFEAHENYQKRSYRNRGYILGTNGPLLLSVPLQKGKNQQTPISRVNISNEIGWKRDHLRSIMSAYGSAPFYDYYMPKIKKIYSSNEARLIEWNKTWYLFFKEHLQLSQDYQETKTFMKFSTVPFINLELELKQDFLSNLNYNDSFWYPQVFAERFPFQNNLSILDILFCCGPESSILLKQYWINNHL